MGAPGARGSGPGGRGARPARGGGGVAGREAANYSAGLGGGRRGSGCGIELQKAAGGETRQERAASSFLAPEEGGSRGPSGAPWPSPLAEPLAELDCGAADAWSPRWDPLAGCAAFRPPPSPRPRPAISNSWLPLECLGAPHPASRRRPFSPARAGAIPGAGAGGGGTGRLPPVCGPSARPSPALIFVRCGTSPGY